MRADHRIPRSGERHDCLDPASYTRIFSARFRRRFAAAADAQEAADIRGRHGQISRAAVPQSGHYRRAADGVRAEFRRARESARGNIVKPQDSRLSTGLTMFQPDKDGSRYARQPCSSVQSRLPVAIPTVRSRPIPGQNFRCCRRGWGIPKAAYEFADMRAANARLDGEQSRDRRMISSIR